jgi:coproporphyrinogen III oxidase
MRSKMELFVINLQGKIIKKFQELEPGAEFTVDKWARKEVEILIN